MDIGELQELTKTHPRDFTDDRLDYHIFNIYKGGVGNYNNPNVLTALLAEKNRRANNINFDIAQKNFEASHEISMSNHDLSKSGKTLSKWALGIAVFSAIITAVFSVAAYNGSNHWEDKQLNMLEQIRDKLPTQPLYKPLELDTATAQDIKQ